MVRTLYENSKQFICKFSLSTSHDEAVEVESFVLGLVTRKGVRT